MSTHNSNITGEGEKFLTPTVLKREPGLDLLRSLAIAAVVLYHYPKAPHQVGLRAVSHLGWAGVDLFFVLSGFLIAHQYFSRAAEGVKETLPHFYARRFFRTWPSYYAVLFLKIGMQEGLFSDWWKYLIFIQNFGLPLIFSQSWSLCVEEHFYLALPPILWGLSRLSQGSFHFSKRTQYAAVSVLIVGGMFLRFMIWNQFRPDLLYRSSVDQSFEVFLSRLYYPTYTRLDGLSVGVFLGWIRVHRPALWTRWTLRGNVFLALALIFLALAAGILRFRMSFFATVLGFPLLALGFGSLLVFSVCPNSFMARWRIPGCKTLAVLSYAIYLTHVDALGLAERLIHRLGGSPNGGQLVLLSVLFIASFGFALHHLIEKPFLRLRDRTLPQKPEPARVG